MNAENFTYWLQGFFELKKTIDHREGFSPETVKVIEDHLQLVFNKVTPDYSITQSPSLKLSVLRDNTFQTKPFDPMLVTC